MRMSIVSVGKKHDSKIADAIADYQKRACRYMPLEWRFVQIKHSTSADSKAIRKQESLKILRLLQPEDWVFLLDETGIAITTPQLAQKIENCKNSVAQNIVFIIGGAYGVDETIIKRVDFNWSLSPLVFPHQLVRLLLTEQIYRAHTILAGEKYHHQ